MQKESLSNEWQNKPADFSYLVESGLLFEINRSILNLFGLSLVVKRGPEGQIVLSEQLKDARANPEQAIYDVNTFELGKQKLERFMREYGYQQITQREKVLGWGCQTSPSKYRKRI